MVEKNLVRYLSRVQSRLPDVGPRRALPRQNQSSHLDLRTLS